MFPPRARACLGALRRGTTMRILTKVAVAVLASAICASTAQAYVATYVAFAEEYSFGHPNGAYAAYNAHPGLGYLALPNLDSSGATSLITCGDPGGCSITLSGTPGSSPSATASFDRLSSTTAGTYSAFATTDLSTGKIGASASSYGDVLAGAFAFGQLGDGLNFTVAGATASTVTNIGVTFDIHGMRSTTDGDITVRNILNFGDAGLDYSLSQRGLGAPAIGKSAFGWVSYSFDESVPDHTTFRGVYALRGASQRLMFGEGFWTTAYYNGATSDYASTSSFSFVLPSEVTYTSDSGVFLTGLGGVGGGVPEPATWALMLAGFGLVGSALRRRQGAGAQLA